MYRSYIHIITSHKVIIYKILNRDNNLKTHTKRQAHINTIVNTLHKMLW